MHPYTSHSDDALCFSRVNLSPGELITASEQLLGESRETIKTVQLAPFCIGNPTPPVNHFSLFMHFKTFFELLLYLISGSSFIQENPPWWKTE